jgi:hypothetical protein
MFKKDSFNSIDYVALHVLKAYRSMMKSNLQSKPDCGMNIKKLSHYGKL